MAALSSLKRQKAIAALMAYPSIRSAAESCGIGERTLYRWVAEDRTFQAQLAAAEAELVDQTARRLLSLTGGAIKTLAQLTVGAEDDGIRLRTAVAILDQASRWRDSTAIERRIQALERGDDE
jgi:hypothetical protein